MTFFQYSVNTTAKVQFITIDHLLNRAISECGMDGGLCVVFVPHTTAAVTNNENADPDVVHDMIMEINKVIPNADHYQHMEGNSAAHIKSTLVGPSLTLIVNEGRVVLGTWQSVYFCEFDGPRQRKVYIKLFKDQDQKS
jgi:secondary thiamine-phosphate synthase enzyme